MRRRRRRRRKQIRTMRLLVAVIRVLLVVLLIVSTIRVLMYAADYIAARRASRALREAYLEAAETTAGQTTPEPVLEALPMDTPVPEAEAAPAAVYSADPVDPAADVLPAKRYPGNPDAKVSSQFAKLRRQNSDIVGWLTIEDIVNEAVVQRDNEYYLRRDYRGYHNDNGAIFLDEYCDLRTRPYTLMLFGHNMKNGLMFGSLRNYEDVGFYRRNPFITFDLAYEKGRYVIFSVATISLDPQSSRYLDVAGLRTQSISRRRDAISALKRCSIYSAMIDVEPEDQILLLVTCVDDDEERRVVAARRIRPDEDEERLRRYIQDSRRQ